MVKCTKCSKVVNKNIPGILCTRCNKWFHGACVSLTIEQLSTLHKTEDVDWKCMTCARGSASNKPKRLSYIIPDTELEEDMSCDPTEIFNQPTVTKFLDQMRKEIRKVVTDELQQSLKFYADKIDDFEVRVNSYETKIKTMENKFTDFKNQQKNMQLNYESLEQKYNSLLQDKWANYIEICGIREEEHEDVGSIAKNICVELKQNEGDIISVYRKPNKRRAGPSAGDTIQLAPQPIVVSLKEGRREQWILAAKSSRNSNPSSETRHNKLYYIRESLSPTTAFILYKAKNDLKNTGLCEYIWCQNGLVLARKNQNNKIYSIRVESDIKRLAEIFKKE